MAVERHRLLVAALLMAVLPAAGQDDPVARVLRETSRLPEVQAAESTAAFLSAHPATLPWIERLEFRTETREFDPALQRYALRLSPADPATVSRQRRLHQLRMERQRLAAREVLQEKLTEACRTLSGLHLCERELVLARKALSMEESRLRLLGGEGRRQGPDLDDLVDAESGRLRALARLGELERRRFALQRGLEGIAAPTGEELRNYPWIGTDSLIALVAGGIGRENLEVLAERTALMEARAELAREKAEAFRIVDFVQARYRPDEDLDPAERLSIGLGVRLPLPGTNRVRRQELALEVEEASRAVELASGSSRQAQAAILDELRMLADQKRELEKAVAGSFLHGIAEGRFPGISTDAMLVPEAALALLRLEEEVLRIDERIAERYLDWLELSGVLSELPRRNYLRQGLPAY